MDQRSEKEIVERFGFVPDFYECVPEAIDKHAWAMQRDLELTPTALEPKVKELIGLAIAAHIKCRYCTYFHSKAAVAHGASEEELSEAVAMGGFTSLMSNSINGAEYDLDKFRREVDKAIQYMGSHPPQPSAH